MNDEKNVNNSNSESSQKAKSQIFSIIVVALIIIAVAFVFIFDKIQEDLRMEEQAQKISENISSSLDKNYKEASEVKEKNDKAVCGTYKSVGYSGEATIEINEDGTITVVKNGTKGWWTSDVKDGVVYVGMIFQEGEEPDIYQLCGSRLIDTQSIYYGDVKVGEPFDSELRMGNMTLTLSKNGKVSGRYTEKVVEDGVEYPYSEAYGGSYTVDGDRMKLTLNGDEANFVIFDYEDENIMGGIASLYYERID